MGKKVKLKTKVKMQTCLMFSFPNMLPKVHQILYKIQI